jgi:hypothetical protein
MRNNPIEEECPKKSIIVAAERASPVIAESALLAGDPDTRVRLHLTGRGGASFEVTLSRRPAGVSSRAGVVPDHPVPLTLGDLRSGGDAALEKAIRVLDALQRPVKVGPDLCGRRQGQQLRHDSGSPIGAPPGFE